MAYNPGVQSRVGEFYAQGLSGLGAGIASGVEAFKRREQENKDVQAKGKAAASFLKTFGKDLGMSEEQLSQFLTQQPDETPRQYAVRLSEGLGNAIMGQKVKAMKAEMDAQAQQQQQLARLQQLGRFMGGEGSGVYSPQAQQAMQQQMQNNPFLRTAAQAAAATGQVPSAGAVLDYDFKQQSMRSPNAIEPFSGRSVDDRGNPVEVTVDKKTGKEIMRGPVNKPPSVPDPLINSMYQDFSKERQERVLPALSSLRAYEEIEKILKGDEGKVISGAFANPELLAKRVASALGAKNVDVKNTETMRALFAVPVAQIIRNFGAGTGLSDADREFAAKAAGGDITLNAESIKELVRIGKEASENIRAQYEERLDSAFPEDGENPAFRQVRKALMLPKGGVKPAPAPAAGTAAPAPTSPADAILRKYGIK